MVGGKAGAGGMGTGGAGSDGGAGSGGTGTDGGDSDGGDTTDCGAATGGGAGSSDVGAHTSRSTGLPATLVWTRTQTESPGGSEELSAPAARGTLANPRAAAAITTIFRTGCPPWEQK